MRTVACHQITSFRRLMTNVCGLKLKNRKLLAILLYSDTQSTSVFSPRATVWYNARGKKQATSIEESQRLIALCWYKL
ncbi:unnamed protein product [Macrosiphum euphorbiae]|uniref:Uncharacterized protein n=1 Tax=Macrosiphum euphorbiae TaxID=13131 RepID=A0AAV0XHX3_9HEMI|nr:unnamed protein product [Macrosiphum euphorbiae]